MSNRKVIIKKYENRRLYDTSVSRYVNLEDVARMVREGTDVQVVDARSGEDLTRVTLTQVIMEDAKGHDSGLPLELLRRLIVASDRATHDFLTWYLTTVTDMYQKAQIALTTNPLERVRSLFGSPQGAPMAEVEALRLRVQELERTLADARGVRKRRKRTLADARGSEAKEEDAC